MSSVPKKTEKAKKTPEAEKASNGKANGPSTANEEVNGKAPKVKTTKKNEEDSKKKSASSSTGTSAKGSMAVFDEVLEAAEIDAEVEKLYQQHPTLKEIQKLKKEHDETQKLKQDIVFGKAQATDKIMERITSAAQNPKRIQELQQRWAMEKEREKELRKRGRKAIRRAAAALAAAMMICAVEQSRLLQERLRREEEERKAREKQEREERERREQEERERKAREEAERKAKEEERKRLEAEQKREEEERKRQAAEEEKAQKEEEAKRKRAEEEEKRELARKQKAEAAMKKQAEPEEDGEEEEPDEPPAKAPAPAAAEDDEDEGFGGLDMLMDEDRPPTPKKKTPSKPKKQEVVEEEEEETEKPKGKATPEPAPVPFTFVRNKGKETKKRVIDTPEEFKKTKPSTKKDKSQTPPPSEAISSKEEGKPTREPEEDEGPIEPMKPKKPRPKREYTLLQRPAVTRLQRELKELLSNPMDTVRALPLEDNLLEWHVTVSPKEGPFAGHVVRFVLHFPDIYPIASPQVEAFFEFPNQCLMGSDNYEYEMCLDILDNTVKGRHQGSNWSGVYTVAAICRQLQNILHDEQFLRTKRSYGNEYQRSLRNAIKAADQDTCTETGHALQKPWPPIPTYNGPFARSGGITIEHGFLVCPDDQQWHTAVCEPTSSTTEVHRFRAVVGRPGALRIGCTSSVSGVEGASPLGEDASSVAIADDGQLFDRGSAVSSSSAFTLAVGDVVECTIDYPSQQMSFMVNGAEAEASSVALADLTLPLCPAVSLFGGTAIELQILGKQSDLALSSDVPVAAAEASSSSSNDLVCFFTKCIAAESMLGVGLHVQRSAGPLIQEISSAWDLISKAAFDDEKVRWSADGSKFEYWLPLPLNQDHKSLIALLKAAFVTISRDPKASTLYAPPFKSAMVLSVMPKLLISQFVSLEKTLQNSTFSERLSDTLLFGFQQLHYLFLLVTESIPGVAKDVQSLVNDFLEKNPLSSPSIDSSKAGQLCPTEILSLTVLDDQARSAVLPIVLKWILSGCKQDASQPDMFAACRSHLQTLMIQWHLLESHQKVTMAEFSASQGIPTDSQKRQFYATCRHILNDIHDWQGFFAFMRSDNFAEQTCADMVR